MNRIVVILVLVTSWSLSNAQDPQFSQYYQAPLYVNPGFTGVTESHRIIVNHRIQWPDLPQAFSTYAVSYDTYVEKIRSGVGILLTSDRMGSANWNTTTAQMLYSYKIPLTEKLIFSPGLSFAYGSNGIDRSKLRMADGLEHDGMSLDPKIDLIKGQQYFDFSSGFVLYTKQVWLGASFMHMNRPGISLLDEASRLGMKSSVHGGIRLDISNRLRAGRGVYFTPSFVYRTQGNQFSQLDLGTNFHVDPVSVGLWYRGIPLTRGVNNGPQHDAFVLFMGLYLKNLTVGYSYDFTVSSLHNASGGSHEISLTYEFASKKRKPKRQKLIPCPAFYGRR